MEIYLLAGAVASFETSEEAVNAGCSSTLVIVKTKFCVPTTGVTGVESVALKENNHV